MISPKTAQPLRELEDQVRAARVQAVRRWVCKQTMRHVALCVFMGLLCAALSACGGGDPEDEARPCIVDGKPYKPEVCR